MRIPDFDFDPRTRVIFGNGTLSQLGELVGEHGGSRVLLVSDKGLREAGHEEKARSFLADAGLSVVTFDDVHPNPTSTDIEHGTEFAKGHDVDFIVGVGGGSSMDCAKGINFLLTNGGKMSDYKGVGKATRPMLPLIAVPTTAGTGSEAQSFAVIADPKTHMKMACGDKKALAKVAILDPELTGTMPRAVCAATGIDAISHAIESFVTKTRGPMSQLFSRKAWQLLSHSYSSALNNSDDLSARGAMLLGAHFAGAAIENSMLGATHALANPLSAHYEMVHGVAIGILLPHVIRYNGADEEICQLYGLLAEDAGLCDRSDPESPQVLASFIRGLVAQAGQPMSLSECDIDESMFSTMSEEAALQWTGQNNPRSVDALSLLELYQCAFRSELDT